MVDYNNILYKKQSDWKIKKIKKTKLKYKLHYINYNSKKDVFELVVK